MSSEENTPIKCAVCGSLDVHGQIVAETCGFYCKTHYDEEVASWDDEG